jgi:hypothetical protein
VISKLGSSPDEDASRREIRDSPIAHPPTLRTWIDVDLESSARASPQPPPFAFLLALLWLAATSVCLTVPVSTLREHE